MEHGTCKPNNPCRFQYFDNRRGKYVNVVQFNKLMCPDPEFPGYWAGVFEDGSYGTIARSKICKEQLKYYWKNLTKKERAVRRNEISGFLEMLRSYETKNDTEGADDEADVAHLEVDDNVNGGFYESDDVDDDLLNASNEYGEENMEQMQTGEIYSHAGAQEYDGSGHEVVVDDHVANDTARDDEVGTAHLPMDNKMNDSFHEIDDADGSLSESCHANGISEEGMSNAKQIKNLRKKIARVKKELEELRDYVELKELLKEFKRDGVHQSVIWELQEDINKRKAKMARKV